MDLGVSHASSPPKRAEFQRSPIFGVLHLSLHALTQNDQIRHGNTYGEGRVLDQHAIAFAQMRRAVCQRQLSYLSLLRKQLFCLRKSDLVCVKLKMT